MNKDLNKKKSELLKSIMGNPKLSRVFTEALSSPIGSTKRQQSKSILSIMKKMGGLRYDGQGGPGTVYSQPASSKQSKDYSNMIIFPAAPKFKTKKENKNDGQGGPDNVSSFGNFDFGNTNLFGQTKTYTAPEPPKNPFAAIPPAVKKVTGTVGEYGSRTGEALGAFNPFAQKPDIGFSGQVSPFGTYEGSTPSVLGKYITPQKGVTDYTFPSLTQGVTKPSFQGPTPAPEGYTKPQEPVSTGAPSAGQIPSDVPQPSGITEGAPSVPAPTGDIYSRAQQAVTQGIGPASFALGVTTEKFGGGLEKYLDELDTKLKKDFKVDEAEQSLSDIASLKSNFVPTMENYIRGKDQYLKFVDNLIDQTNDSLMTMDTSNPTVKNQMDTYLTYLYTLKGRQNQRYGSLLNNAISDYNADAERIQNQYNSVYKQYNDTITRKATIAQNEYNTLYATMSDLYNNLQEAPNRQLQNELLKEQLLNAHLVNLQNATKSQTTNYWPEQKEYKDQVLDDKGNLLSSNILNLPTIYSQANTAGKNLSGVTDLVSRGVATGLSNAKKEGSDTQAFELIKDYRNMINNLATIPGGLNYANQISQTLGRTGTSLVSDYVLKNAPNFKQALGSLTSGGWVGKSYLTKNDKEGWIKSNSTLDKNILGDIFDAVKMTASMSDAYSKNPEKLFTLTADANGNPVYGKNISDTPDEVISNNVSNILSSMWMAEPNNLNAATSQ